MSIEKPIFLLSGATGVGTSRFSLELAKKYNIPTIVSTDIIRESIRSVIQPTVSPVLGTSTYLAGKTINYQKKLQEVQKSEILRAFKNQCDPIFGAVERIIIRAITENIPVIIEGVHLRPGRIQESPIYQDKKVQSRLAECLIYISNQEVHRSRFMQRQKDAPKRHMQKYLDNFQEIRWIHDYLFCRAQRKGISLLDNKNTLEKGIGELYKLFS